MIVLVAALVIGRKGGSDMRFRRGRRGGRSRGFVKRGRSGFKRRRRNGIRPRRIGTRL